MCVCVRACVCVRERYLETLTMRWPTLEGGFDYTSCTVVDKTVVAVFSPQRLGFGPRTFFVGLNGTGTVFSVRQFLFVTVIPLVLYTHFHVPAIGAT